MKKKTTLTSLGLIVALGAVFVASQIVWAADGPRKKQEVTQVSETDHASHHLAAQMSEPTMAAPDMTQVGNINAMMNNGSQDMMKNMANGEMMQDGSMKAMMNFMNTPEGKQMMEQCQKVLGQNTENKSTVE